jgi:hypothetical protein
MMTAWFESFQDDRASVGVAVLSSEGERFTPFGKAALTFAGCRDQLDSRSS